LEGRTSLKIGQNMDVSFSFSISMKNTFSLGEEARLGKKRKKREKITTTTAEENNVNL